MRLVAADNEQAFPVPIDCIHDNKDLLKKAYQLVILVKRTFVFGRGLRKAGLDQCAESAMISDQNGDVSSRCQ